MIVAVKNIFNITKGKKVDSVLEKAEQNSLRYIQIGDLRNDRELKYTADTNLIRVNESDVVIAWDGANAGTVGFGLNGIIGSTLARLSIKDKFQNQCNSIYLGYFLSTKFDYLQNTATGATIPHVSKSALESITISLPDLETQNKIVAILDKAKAILDKREEAIKKYDELLRATFLGMFGDPVKNPKGWKTKSLLKYGDFKNGLNYKSDETGINVLCLGVGDFKSNWILKSVEYLTKVSLEKKPSENYFLKDNDLVFVRSNGNKQLVGRCILVKTGKEKVTFSGFCIRYRLNNNKISPIYLAHLFRVPTFKRTMLENGRGANIQNINQELLNKLSIPIPSKKLQIEFEKRIISLQVLFEKIIFFRTKCEELLKSLSLQVFSERITIDVDTELQVLINTIDLDKKDEENKIDSIKGDVTFVQRLLDRMNEHDFKIKDDYDKAQYVLFRIMTEETNLIKQIFKDDKIILTLQNETY